jgi:hypothetical protein
LNRTLKECQSARVNLKMILPVTTLYLLRGERYDGPREYVAPWTWVVGAYPSEADAVAKRDRIVAWCRGAGFETDQREDGTLSVSPMTPAFPIPPEDPGFRGDNWSYVYYAIIPIPWNP